MRRSVTVLLVVCLLGGGLAAGVVGGVSEYDLTIAGSVDTPDRTLPIGGQQFTVTEVASVDPGQSLLVDVNAPDEGRYDLLLYDSDRRIVRRVDAVGGERSRVETDGLEPGAYLLALRDDGEVHAVHPVVVDGYAVDLDVPNAVRGGTSTTVVVSVRGERSTRDPHQVMVVASSGEGAVSTVAEREADGRYVARLDLADVPPGEYTVFASVQGEDVVYGRPEPLGLSDGHQLNVTGGAVDDERTPGTATERDVQRSATSEGDAPSRSMQPDIITPRSDRGLTSSANGNLFTLVMGGVAVLVGYAFLRRW